MSLRDTEVDKFNRNLRLLLSHHNELKLAIHNKKNEASLESELVTQFVLSVSVLWQSFVHDLFIAYILMAPSRTVESTKDRVAQSIQAKFGPSVLKRYRFIKPKKPSRPQILGLLDPRGWNISVTTAHKLAAKANELLASRYAIKFSLDSDSAEFFDYMAVLRNFLSHHSKGARKKLAETINGLNENINDSLKGNFRQIGPYLKASVGNNVTRAEFIVQRLQNISNSL